jgi:hypothetical protein
VGFINLFRKSLRKPRKLRSIENIDNELFCLRFGGEKLCRLKVKNLLNLKQKNTLLTRDVIIILDLIDSLFEN